MQTAIKCFLFIICLLCFGSIGSIGTIQAQIDNFSIDPIELSTQLDQFFVKYQEKGTQATLGQFKSYMNSGAFSEQDLLTITELFNEMKRKKMKPSPYFDKAMGSINEIEAIESMQSGKYLENWCSVAFKHASKQKEFKAKMYGLFLDFSLDFFKQGALYTSASKDWKIENSQFEFLWEEDKPKMRITELNSLCAVTKNDSICIQETKGLYDILGQKWFGEEGMLTWERQSSLNDSTTFVEPARVEFKDYKIELKKPNYEIENVQFFHDDFFEQPITGTLSDNFTTGKSSESYPRFRSKDTNVSLKNLFPKIEFKGGFGLNGQKIVVFGAETKRANMVVVNEEGNPLFRATSPLFGVRDRQKISSQSTGVSLYFKNDSIYHPNLDLTFEMNSKDLRVVRSEETTAQAPFTSSYHNIEVEIDAVSWNLLDSTIVLTKSSQVREKPVYVDSYNYYNPRILQKYRKAINKDPVIILSNWYGSTGDPEMAASDFARQLRDNYTVEDVINVIYDLVNDGFIFYYPETKMINIRPKSQLYAQAQLGKSDYDIITMKSIAHNENISLDLETADLSVIGVDQVVLSDTQRVIFFPYDKFVKINENRNLKVKGDLVAGQMDFVRGDYSLDYDQFKIDIDSADNLIFYVKDEEVFHGDQEMVKTKPLKTPLQDVSGVLYIDQPDNKSGKEDYGEYPIFETKQNSYIYYDTKELFDGAYERDRFYFEIDGFRFENVNTLEKDQFLFPGTMVYGDIFPNLRVKASLDEELNLAVNSDVTGTDYPMYGDIGMYNGEVKLSKKGLRGNGTIEFMTTTVTSQDFIFFPDSTICDSIYSVIIEKREQGGVNFPDVVNSGIEFKWFPYNDSLMLYGTKNPFSLFEGRSQFRGRIQVTEGGMFADGAMSWNGSTIRSNLFSFNQTTIFADSMNVSINAENGDLVLESDTALEASIDVYNELAVFEPGNTETIKLNLPEHEFTTELDLFNWDYKEKVINMQNTGDKDNFFTAKDPRLKGLKIKPKLASLNLETKELKMSGIQQINVADARIMPSNNSLILRPGAEIKRLENATIIVDTAKAYHFITDATVDIFNGLEFKAQGNYLFKSKFFPEDQTIFFEKIESRTKGFAEEEAELAAQKAAEKLSIESESSKTNNNGKKKKKKKKSSEAPTIEEVAQNAKTQETSETQKDGKKKKRRNKDAVVEEEKEVYRTYSKARLAPEDAFKLDPKTNFKGKVYLDSQNRFLTFDGFSRIDLTVPQIQPEWFKFRSEINPENLQIDLTSPIGEYKDTLYFGTFFSFEKLKPYTTFINSKRTPADFGMINVKGLLDYNPEKGIYRIGDADKLSGNKKQGNVLALKDNDEKEVITEGKIQLGRDFGILDVNSGGRIVHSLADSTFRIEEMVLALDFIVDEKAFEFMVDDIKGLVAENKEVNYLSSGFARGLTEVLPTQFVEPALVHLAQNAYFQIPEKGFDYKLFLANINMEWDDINASFRSVGPIGLGYMQQTYVNRMMDGYIEFAPRRKGDYFHIYLSTKDIETGRNEWYYIHYKNGFLQMLSSNAGFNQAIAKISAKKRKIESKDKSYTYQYALASTVLVNSFLARMKEGEKK